MKPKDPSGMTPAKQKRIDLECAAIERKYAPQRVEPPARKVISDFQKVGWVELATNKGHKIWVHPDATLKEMVEGGLSQFALDPIGSPVPDGWYADLGVKSNNSK